jgi:hypothetical protein
MIHMVKRASINCFNELKATVIIKFYFFFKIINIIIQEQIQQVAVVFFLEHHCRCFCFLRPKL